MAARYSLIVFMSQTSLVTPNSFSDLHYRCFIDRKVFVAIFGILNNVILAL